MKRCCEGFGYIEYEYCFLQYYRVLNGEYLPIDRIDISLSCVLLLWHRTPRDEDHSSAREYGIVTIGILQGRVHIVRKDFELPLVSDVGETKSNVHNLCMDRGWI